MSAAPESPRPACECRIVPWTKGDSRPKWLPAGGTYTIEHGPAHDPANVARLVEAGRLVLDYADTTPCSLCDEYGSKEAPHRPGCPLEDFRAALEGMKGGVERAAGDPRGL